MEIIIYFQVWYIHQLVWCLQWPQTVIVFIIAVLQMEKPRPRVCMFSWFSSRLRNSFILIPVPQSCSLQLFCLQYFIMQANHLLMFTLWLKLNLIPRGLSIVLNDAILIFLCLQLGKSYCVVFWTEQSHRN